MLTFLTVLNSQPCLSTIHMLPSRPRVAFFWGIFTATRLGPSVSLITTSLLVYCRQLISDGPAAVVCGVCARPAGERWSDPASPSYSGPSVLCALEHGGLSVGKQSSRKHANEPGEPPDMQSPCAWGLEGAECQLLGSWPVKLFQVRGTRRAGLVMAFHERLIACIPRCVPLFGVHQTLDDSRTFRLLGTSPQCPYLGKIQNLLSHPQWLVEADHREEPVGGRG